MTQPLTLAAVRRMLAADPKLRITTHHERRRGGASVSTGFAERDSMPQHVGRITEGTFEKLLEMDIIEREHDGANQDGGNPFTIWKRDSNKLAPQSEANA